MAVDSAKDTVTQIKSIVDGLSADAKAVLAAVIECEQAHLHLGNPHGVENEIVKAVERVIR